MITLRRLTAARACLSVSRLPGPSPYDDHAADQSRRRRRRRR
ncbi:hypothetical protein [Actinomadura luzonensis]|nr:hypothetical protein [Actinomadura luzonensis]